MRLAYAAADGSPRVIPLGYLPGADTLLTWTIPTSAKVSSLQADPRVAVTIDIGGIPPCALLLRGTATLEPVDGIPDGYLEASGRTMDPAVYDQWEQGVRALYDSMTWVVVGCCEDGSRGDSGWNAELGRAPKDDVEGRGRREGVRGRRVEVSRGRCATGASEARACRVASTIEP
jgi:hypothetical protein